MTAIIQWKRGTAASWTDSNPTLEAGEAGFETDTGKFKIGDGETSFADLPYAGSGEPEPIEITLLVSDELQMLESFSLDMSENLGVRFRWMAAMASCTSTGEQQITVRSDSHASEDEVEIDQIVAADTVGPCTGPLVEWADAEDGTINDDNYHPAVYNRASCPVVLQIFPSYHPIPGDELSPSDCGEGEWDCTVDCNEVPVDCVALCQTFRSDNFC